MRDIDNKQYFQLMFNIYQVFRSSGLNFQQHCRPQFLVVLHCLIHVHKFAEKYKYKHT